MKTSLVAAVAAIGLLSSVAVTHAQGVTIDTGGARVVTRGEGVRVIDRDRRGDYQRRSYADRRDGEGRRTVRKTVTRNPDGSVTRSKTIRTQDDD